MSEEFLKTDEDMVDEHVEITPYQEYLDLGGIINENDYNSALSREDAETIDKTQISQVNGMIDFANIELAEGIDINQVTKLYSILRNDIRPSGVKHHHDTMSDQQILVETLRMLGDARSVDKMIATYPNISFIYQRNSPEQETPQ